MMTFCQNVGRTGDVTRILLEMLSVRFCLGHFYSFTLNLCFFSHHFARFSAFSWKNA